MCIEELTLNLLALASFIFGIGVIVYIVETTKDEDNGEDN